jgi:DNA-directed RNA polymerase subunit RPC12/RpoP
VPADATSLTILTCPKCGAGVPVANEPRTACAYCREPVEVPDSYREALLVAQGEVQADELTRKAFATLGKPPSWPLRVIDVLTTGGYSIITVVFLSVAGMVNLANWSLDHCASWLHVNAWDWFSPPELNLLVWGPGFAALLALFALGAFGRRKVSELRGLHQALAARPPARPGGPAQCRLCGAPLSVPSDAFGVRCTYCRSDNLVSIPASWLARERGALGSVRREAKNALHAYRAETRRLYLRLALRLGVISSIAALTLTSTVREVFAQHGGNFDLRAALRAPRELFDIQPGAVLLGTPDPPVPTIPVDQCRSQWQLAPDTDLHCLGNDCSAGWFSALRAGEVLEVTLSAAAHASFVAHYKDRGWTASYGRSALWGREIATAVSGPGQPVTFRAPNTSWYRLDFSLQGVTEDVDICAKIR